MSVFGDNRNADLNGSLAITAKQVRTFSEGTLSSQASPAGKLANMLQREIDNFCRLNPNFPPPRTPPQPRATLLIIDRSIDPAAPLLHEFTYQAMINDLLDVSPSENLNGIKYSYEYHQSDGSMDTKEVLLDEDDNVYKSVRHMHIAECSDRLVEKFNEFLAENKQADAGDRIPGKTTAKSLKDMKDMLSNLPQYQDLKAKYSAHLSIAQECMSYFERHKLNSVGNLEQNMATGETADGETPKTIVLDMVPLLDDPHVSSADKARLLMLYIIWKEGGLFEDDKRKLLEHAKLKGELRDAINNLPLIGVKVTRVRNPEKSFFKKRRDRSKRNKDEETPYELSRYVPVVKKVMEAHFNNTLDPAQFSFTKESDMDSSEHGPGNVGQGGIPASGVSLRTTKPTWSKRANSPGMNRVANGAKLIVFVIGGATYSEIRSVYELAESYNKDIFIGSTELLTPCKFLDQLAHLHDPVPSSASIIPPYVTPPPPRLEPINKTTSFLSHMTITTPPPLITKSSSASLATAEKTEEVKEKKKKKGLMRLFG
ncbi:Sec1-like protein [Pilobolus umbonatus]|nr:Sec1-like protein [Pilobolus umbonatus]